MVLRTSADPVAKASRRDRQQASHRTRLYAAAVKVKTTRRGRPPRWRSLRRPPTVFIQPKPCSTSFRFR